MKKTTLTVLVACFAASSLFLSFTSNFASENYVPGSDDDLLKPKIDSVIANSDNSFTNEMESAVPESGTDLIADLQSRINYPQRAIDQKIEGTVEIMITVDPRGNVENVKLVKDIGGKCGEEACRAARTMKFKPAMQNGFAIKQNFNVPVVFSLSSLY
jgi:protein TonB